MTRTLRTALVVPVLLAMIVTLFAAATTTVQAAPVTSAVSASSHHRHGTAVSKKKPYRVKPGVTMNSPYGRLSVRRAIISKVLDAVNHTPKDAKIRIFSWNIYSWATVNTLIHAQRRGVHVRVIMDKSNVGKNWPNPFYHKLNRYFVAWNKQHPKRPHSFVKLCRASCRGKAGAAHSKFFLFSKVGASKNVYMETSSNLTDAAAGRQWNDMYTMVGRKNIYRLAVKVFTQAVKDKPVKGPWEEYATKDGFVAAWSPYDAAARKNDRLLATLKRTKCYGAKSPAGNGHGRTVIRAAPDVMRNDRGWVIAKQFRRLWNNGCDVKIGYTVMGIAIMKMLRAPGGRGPVPRYHLVRDDNQDGMFDRYFHMKVVTINGHIGKNRQAYWMVNGSANTSGGSMHSDENYMYIIGHPKVLRRYQNHLNYWFGRFPRVLRTPEIRARIASGEIDPYAHVDMD